MKQYKKRIFGILLSFALMLTMMPVLGLSLTAYADTAYSAYLVNDNDDSETLPKKVVKFNGYDWYIIKDESASVSSGTVTLLSADTRFGTLAFKSDNSSHSYNDSDVKAYLDNIVSGNAGEGKPDFKDVADAIQPVTLTTYKYNSEEVYQTTANAKIYLLSTEEAKSLPENVRTAEFTGEECDYNQWWLRSPGSGDSKAAIVVGQIGEVYDPGDYVNQKFGVRPALKLDLSKVEFDSTTKSFSMIKADPVSYMAWDDTTKELVNKTGDDACKDYTEVTNQTAWGTADQSTWYVLKESKPISDRITVNGTVNLILCDGATLTASSGITVSEGNTLNIYGQKDGTGTLAATAYVSGSGMEASSGAAIGGLYSGFSSSGSACGTINIHGGTVNANKYVGDGHCYAAGIGGAGMEGGDGGAITVYSGTVNAYGNSDGAGIGSSEWESSGGSFTMYGGTVTAEGGSSGGGISGGGGQYGTAVTAAIYGGTVTATGGQPGNTNYHPGDGIGYGPLFGNETHDHGTLTAGAGVTIQGSNDNTTWTTLESPFSTRYRYMKAEMASTHTHSFTYQASDSTITATCSAEGCDLPPSTTGGSDHVATLTIAAPDSLAYDGTAKAAKITDANKIQGAAKVMYQKKTGDKYGTETDTAPTDAGTYKASITLGEGDGAKTASVEYTIKATALTITDATLTSRDYEKDNKSVTVTAVTFSGGSPTINTDFTATAEMEDDTAGDSKDVTVTVTLSNPNYSLAKTTFDTTVKINKATPAAPATPTAESKTDTSVTLKATDGYQYKCNENEWQDSNEFTGLTEDTSYNFYQRVKGDANHNDSASSPVAVIKTNQEPISYTVYSKSGNFIVITTKTISEYIKAQTTNNTVWLKDRDFYVVKGNVTLNKGLVYSGNVTIILCDNSKLTIKGGIWHYGSELTIYGQSGQSGEIVVEGDKTITPDNVPAGKTISTDSALDGGTININGGKLSVTPGPGQDVCGANATVSFLSNVSMTGTTTGGEVTLTEGTYGPTELNRFTTFVTKGSAIVKTEPAAKSLTENGSAQQLVTAGEAENGTMQYVLGKDATTVPTSGWGEAIPTGTNAGTYYVWYKAKGDDPYGDSLPVCVTVTIAKKSDPAPTPTPIPATASVTINSKTVSAKTLNAAIAKAGVSADSVKTITLGKKVKKIKKGAFKNFRNANTLVVKSKKLTRARVKGSLKGSTIKTVKVNVGKKKTNKKYVKRYKKIFTKKNCGKKVRVTR